MFKGLKDVSQKMFYNLRTRKPEILVGTGIVLSGIALYSTYKATRKCNDTIEYSKKKISEKKEILSSDSSDEIKDKTKSELTDIYTDTLKVVFKSYSKPVVLYLLGSACILKGFGIVKHDRLELAAAITAISERFNFYRNNVKEELGEEADERFKYGIKNETLEYKDEKTGKKKKENVSVIDDEYLNVSRFARFFDETSDMYKDPDEYGGVYYNDNSNLNLDFLIEMQNQANILLQSSKNGILFLSTVYEMLGFEVTQESRKYGWSRFDGDGCVDFGIHSMRKANRRFVNGYEKVVLLDFNVNDKPVDVYLPL